MSWEAQNRCSWSTWVFTAREAESATSCFENTAHMAQLHAIVCRTRNRVPRYRGVRQLLDLYPVSRRIEKKRARAFSRNEPSIPGERVHLSDVHLATLTRGYDQWRNAAAKNGFARALIAIAPAQYRIPRPHKVACFVTHYTDLGHARSISYLENAELPRDRERKWLLCPRIK